MNDIYPPTDHRMSMMDVIRKVRIGRDRRQNALAHQAFLARAGEAIQLLQQFMAEYSDLETANTQMYDLLQTPPPPEQDTYTDEEMGRGIYAEPLTLATVVRWLAEGVVILEREE